VKWFGVKGLGRADLGGRRGDDRGRRGGDFGLEFFEGLERAVISAAGGIYAVLEFGKGGRVAGGRLSEGYFCSSA
jgi:hypothetical protein